MRGDVDDVRILRMDLQLADLPDFLQPRELPRLPRVDRLVDAAADDHVRSDRFAAGAGVDDVRIRIGDVDRADRSGRNLAVGHRHPGDAVVLGLPHAAAGRAHVEHVGLRAHAGRRRRSAAACRADRSPAQILVGVRVDDDVRVGLRDRARVGSRVAEHDEGERGDGEQQSFLMKASPDEATILLPARVRAYGRPEGLHYDYECELLLA